MHGNGKEQIREWGKGERNGIGKESRGASTLSVIFSFKQVSIWENVKSECQAVDSQAIIIFSVPFWMF